MRVMFRIRAAAAALACATVAAACSQSPVAPSGTTVQPTAADVSVSAESPVTTQAVGVSAEDLAARGWTCVTAPNNPNRVVCSPPNQGHPVLLPGPPPPADRPATFTLLVFENGVFIGTDLLIRSDLYRGQQCKSTGAPYRLITRIGYYECVHLASGQ